MAARQAPGAVPASSNAREKLLARAVAHVRSRALSDGSLRAIAAEIGTSHRMLIYHFGSAQGFWEAVLAELRATDQRALVDAVAAGRMPTIEQVWAQLSSLRYRPIARLLFQIYGEALGDRGRFERFLTEVVEGWLELIANGLYAEYELSRSEARRQARVRLAVLRGLLLDLLTTGDRKATSAALHAFAQNERLRRRVR
jgi:AcrR family transcriptional regulator